jgi:hypothetical protein
MMRNLKVGMVLAAVLAMSAIGASAAQAGSLDVGAAPATLEGIQGSTVSTKAHLTVTSSIGTPLSGSKCTTASIDATTSTSSVTELTITPSYGGAGTCELGGLAATWSPGSCKFTLSGVGTAASIANVSVTGCTAGLSIVQGSCTLTISNTSVTLAQIKFTSTGGSPDHVTADLEITKIPITGSAGCPANLVGSTNTGDLSGEYTVKAYSDVGGVKGAQVSLTST